MTTSKAHGAHASDRPLEPIVIERREPGPSAGDDAGCHGPSQGPANKDSDMRGSTDLELTRRSVLVGSAAAAALTSLPAFSSAQAAEPLEVAVMSKVAFVVNGQARKLEVDSRTTLLDVLRERLHLTGTKKGCDHGQCGACTAIVGGRRIDSCLTLAILHEGDSVTTIEGLGTPDDLHPMQAAFVEHDGFRCGYRTPGQICSAVSVLDEIQAGIPSHVTVDLDEAPTATEIAMRERMSGNICRCGACSNIAEAAMSGSTSKTP